ncbi:MAG: NifB/NifX family molybdenum-iron cluster-binding protein [Bacteroidales bacterium]|nr:NifB/NifX family molybdenum-iron cluster-binding protein [Bacteroidales bacterium]
MKQKIAIPTSNNSLCVHFGHCEKFAFFDIENGEVINESFVIPPPHQPGLLPAWLSEQGISHVIAGGMGQRAVNLLQEQNITSMVGAPQKPARDLVLDYLTNNLVTGNNSCDH